MQSLSLAPFLASLAVDGMRVTLQDYVRISLALQTAGPWTLSRLRGVLLALLVQDAEQEAAFIRRFESFFSASLETEDAFAEVDLARALADLHSLAEMPGSRDTPVTPKPVRPCEPDPEAPGYGWRTWCAGVVMLLLSLAVGGDTLPSPPPPPPPVAPPSPDGPSLCPTPLQTLSETLPTFVPEDWQLPAGLSTLLVFVILLYGIYLWRSRRLPQDQAPSWDADAPRTFRAGSIGGQPAPWLEAAALDQIADALGYFQSEAASAVLDVTASIEATGQHGGIPALVFRPRKQLRRVLILEDAFAQARAWNPIAQELAAGLTQRGVPVIYGTWHGTLQQFQTAEGGAVQLADLEDDRRGYVLLLFSDSKGIHPQRDVFVLESLARWPMVAWLELREPRFWDESTAMVARYGLPIYPATSNGLLQAMGRFLTERSAQDEGAVHEAPWRGFPAHGGADLAGYVEYLLGDALPWAQACAMVQPVTPGLADMVRRTFCPTLPAERLERLFALPGTTQSNAGLRFALPVLAVLRRGFTVRWDAVTQEEILRFLMHKLQEVEPPQPGSPAHLAWEARLEYVHLELEPDRALRRLAELAGTPLGNAIRADLEHCVLPENSVAQPQSVPLRVKPRSKEALQRLARLVEHSGVRLLEAFPVARGHWLALGLLGLACLGLATYSFERYRQTQAAPPVQMDFVLIPAGTFQMGSNDGDKDERPIHQVTLTRPFYLGKYEVTQAQWQSVMGQNPSQFTGDPQRPVEQVSWEDIQEFLRRLNTTAGRSKYRLPTEAEWEYAARAGTTTAYSFGDDASQLREYAWYGENSGDKTHPVGGLKPNACGLYDMHGNVWEWVQDWYEPYTADPAVDPARPSKGSLRVNRGGSWINDARNCRSANRDNDHPGNRNDNLGFRLVSTR